MLQLPGERRDDDVRFPIKPILIAMALLFSLNILVRGCEGEAEAVSSHQFDRLVQRVAVP